MLKNLLNKILFLKKLWRDNSAKTLVRLFVLKKFNKRKTISLNIYGEEIYVRTSTPDLSVALDTLGDEFQFLTHAYPKDYVGLIIDAGGYIGTAAITLSKMYPEATVVSIEPSTENYEILIINVRKHKNIHACNAALMAKVFNGSVELMNRGTGNWGFTVINKPQDRTASFVENVDVVSIENILEKFGFDKIMILKMDIEGAEFDLFKQSDWLEKTDVLIVEIHERIVAGCEQAFWDANKLRFVYKNNGEKFVSIGKQYFA